MKKLVLFYVLLSGLKLLSQNVNIATHDQVDDVGSLITINSACFYFERVESYAGCSLSFKGLNSSGQAIYTSYASIGSWDRALRMIKTSDHSILLLSNSWVACDLGEGQNYIIKAGLNGAASYTKTIGTSTLASSSVNNIVDLTEAPDSSFYLVSSSELFHYSKAGNFLSYSLNFGGLIGIRCITALSNGHLLLNSTGYNTEITTAGTVVLQQATTDLVLKYVKASSGSVYGLTTSGLIHQYNLNFSTIGSSGSNLSSSLKVTDFIERNDSVFATGFDAVLNTPFYALLDQDLNVLHLSLSSYKNVIPKGIAINANKINIITQGSSAAGPAITFGSVYQFPLTGGFVSTADIGVSHVEVNSVQFSRYLYYYMANYNISATIKNYGNTIVRSFYLNTAFHPDGLCNTYSPYHHFYTDSILPHDSTVVIADGLYSQFYVPSGTMPGSVFHPQICPFTTIPNASNDINVFNDGACGMVDFTTGMEENNLLNDNYITVSPNPSSDVVYINSDQIIKQAIIYNAQGIILQNLFPNGKNFNLNDNELPPGIYFVRFETEKGMAIKKVVKK